MIRRAVGRVIGFLRSTGFAIALLAFTGVWSMVATFVPQGDAYEPGVMAWAAAHPVAEKITGFLGLHQAFTAPVFRVAVVALALSTGLCAWRRTSVARARARSLRRAATASAEDLIAEHDLEIPCSPALSRSEAETRGAEALLRLGLRTKFDHGVLASVSPWWAVLGSPVFHWGLVALIVVVLAGGLVRSEGLMGIAVGETKRDAPESYRVLEAGPLHSWKRIDRSIRVDGFETDYQTGSIDRGPVPTVSVLDGKGQVITTQRVYPNNPLQVGSLTIHPAEFGFAAILTLLDKNGADLGSQTELIDISQETSSGTVPVEPLTLNDAGRQLVVAVTVPMERSGEGLAAPQERVAHVEVFTTDDVLVTDAMMAVGDELMLPSGSKLRLRDLTFYSRLNVVDDPSVPLLYAALAVALAGLAVVVFVRQQIVLGAYVEDGDRGTFLMRLRLWKNVPTNRAEIESELTKALNGQADEEDR
ncbi:MAG: cytochrome c biogenesis protein ResB [Coriobacteriales bacterium]